MAAPARTPDQRERDLEETARLYLQGWSQVKISQKVGVSQPQISLDLKEIRKRWLESSLRHFDELKSEQLAKLDRLEAEAWEAWERSKKPKLTTVSRVGQTKTGDLFDETSEKVEQLIGDPRYMSIIESCILRRCKIIGIDAEIKMQDLNLAIASVVRAGFQVVAPSEN